MFNILHIYLLCSVICLCNSIASAHIGPSARFDHGLHEIGFFASHVTHREAGSMCREWEPKGKLVVIDTRELQDRIESHIREMELYQPSDWTSGDPLSPGFHVGAHDRHSEGEWIWENSIPVRIDRSKGFTNWGPAEPNNYMLEGGGYGEDCMSILMTDAFPDYGYSVGTWIDNGCTEKKFFICQRELQHQVERFCRDGAISGLVELPFQSMSSSCQDVGAGTVVRWRGEKRVHRWIMRNVQDGVEFDINPKRVLSSQFEGGRLYVDKILLKWRRENSYGSQHHFGRRIVAEIQILHENHHTLGRVSLAFLIKERHNPSNRVWDSILHAIASMRRTKSEVEIVSPPLIQRLLSDTHAHHRRDTRNILAGALKYDVTTTDSCGKVTWIVFPRATHMSTSQLTALKSLSPPRREEPTATSKNILMGLCQLLHPS